MTCRYCSVISSFVLTLCTCQKGHVAPDKVQTFKITVMHSCMQYEGARSGTEEESITEAANLFSSIL